MKVLLIDVGTEVCFIRTQSSTYPNAMPTIAGSAVDGNTDGEFLNKSTTRTNSHTPHKLPESSHEPPRSPHDVIEPSSLRAAKA
jgi:hypothetical protein